VTSNRISCSVRSNSTSLFTNPYEKNVFRRNFPRTGSYNITLRLRFRRRPSHTASPRAARIRSPGYGRRNEDLYIRMLSPKPMAITFHATGIVRATREETFAWWTDLREDDAGRVMPPLRQRMIVKRKSEETVTEDRWSIFGIPMRTRATLRPRPPDGWEVTSELRGGTARDVVRLTTVPGGTRVTMGLVMDLRWPWSWAARALRPALARMFQKDLEAVNRSLEASLHGKPE